MKSLYNRDSAGPLVIPIYPCISLGSLQAPSFSDCSPRSGFCDMAHACTKSAARSIAEVLRFRGLVFWGSKSLQDLRSAIDLKITVVSPAGLDFNP